MKKAILVSLLTVMVLSPTVQAKDFGKAGQTFEVVEEGFIEMVKRRLSEIDIDTAKAKMQGIAQDRTNNPVAIAGITRATETKEFYFDPSIVVEEDILLPGGKVLHKAGTRVNPLDHMNLDRRMIFIDGRDESQIEWLESELKKLEHHDAKRAMEAAKNNTTAPIIINRVILTGGKIMELQKQLTRELYFDQAGELTDRFGIKAVPAIAVQEGSMIRIKEIAIDKVDDE